MTTTDFRHLSKAGAAHGRPAFVCAIISDEANATLQLPQALQPGLNFAARPLGSAGRYADANGFTAEAVSVQSARNWPPEKAHTDQNTTVLQTDGQLGPDAARRVTMMLPDERDPVRDGDRHEAKALARTAHATASTEARALRGARPGQAW